MSLVLQLQRKHLKVGSSTPLYTFCISILDPFQVIQSLNLQRMTSLNGRESKAADDQYRDLL